MQMFENCPFFGCKSNEVSYQRHWVWTSNSMPLCRKVNTMTISAPKSGEYSAFLLHEKYQHFLESTFWDTCFLTIKSDKNIDSESRFSVLWMTDNCQQHVVITTHAEERVGQNFCWLSALLLSYIFLVASASHSFSSSERWGESCRYTSAW